MTLRKPGKERQPQSAPSSHAKANKPATEQNRQKGQAEARLPPSSTSRSSDHEAYVTVVNKRGLHARAAAKFVKLAADFEADIQVTAAKGGLAGGAIVSGRSIMGLMMLAAAPGCVLHLSVSGGDAPAALDALVRLVESGFDEQD